MAQNTYLDTFNKPAPGKLADGTPSTKLSRKNTTGAKCEHGVVVSKGSTDSELKRLAGASDKILGIVVHEHSPHSQQSTWPSSAVAFGATDTEESGVPDDKMATVIRQGFVYALCEEAVSYGDPVYARVTASGSEIVGAVRNDPDGTDCILIENMRFAETTTAAGAALVEILGIPEVDTSSDERSFLITLTPGAESGNNIDVVGAVTDADGNAITSAIDVYIESLAETADKGDLATAGTPVGTVKKAVNPATGPNVQWMRTTAAGLFSFRVTNDVAEDTMVKVSGERCQTRITTLTFA